MDYLRPKSYCGIRGTVIVLRIVAVLFLAAGWNSCSVTRRVPQGSYLLTKVDIKSDKHAPRDERVAVADLDRYIRQSPNKRLLWMPFYLWSYNAANPESNSAASRFLRRIGEEPVLLDTMLVSRSLANIDTYMKTRGFFNAREEVTIDTTRRKKAKVSYSITQGKPYRIGRISYDFKDAVVGEMIMQDSARTLIHNGDIFSVVTLDNERLRITEALRDNGYYNFSVNNISYVADSTVGDRKVDLRMVVKQYLAGYDGQGNPRYENSTIYRIREIVIHPNFDPASQTGASDTVRYLGLNIVYGDIPGVRKEILRRAINLYPNSLYSVEEVNRAYGSIMRLGYFKSVNISFTEVPDTVAGRNIVTFVSDNDSQVATTSEDYLYCTIYCTPALRQSYKIEMEASTTSNYNEISATVGYQNRNLFRGAELFDVSIKGGYQFIRAQERSNSYEIGGVTSISFPRFISPVRIDRYNRLMNSRTKVEFSVNAQHRPAYHRILSGASYGFLWSNNMESYSLKPIDVSVIKMNYIDPEFIKSLQNKYLRNSYTSQMMAGISGSYVFNNQLRNVGRDSRMVRINVETAGNLLYGLSELFMQKKDSTYHIFGVPYSQYFRVDLSYSRRFMMGPKGSIAFRLYGGGGLAYGNSMSIPFDRLFFSGGSNSMRGWLARTLGPGSVPVASSLYPSQLGDLKLEANIEARFPVWGLLHGAIFFDLGNIWNIKNQPDSPEGTFRFDRFYKQLGFNTGIGARIDVSYAILRFDWGMRLYDPNLPGGERWTRKFNFGNTALNFGVGLPF